MGLLVPAVGDTDYPSSVSSSFTSVDNHDHTSGKGVQIPSQGIQDSAVTSGKISNGAVIDTKLATDSVTTAKIAANAVTRPKLEAVGQQLSSDINYNVSGSTYADVTNATVTITTSGRPVIVGYMPSSTAGVSQVYAQGLDSLILKIVRGTTDIAEISLTLAIAPAAGTPVLTWNPSWFTIDPVVSGTHIYKLQAKMSGGFGTGQLANLKFFAYEL